MPLSSYRHGFPNKVTIREFPILEIQNGNSNIYWVDSNKGSDGNKGTFDRPFATLDYAIGRCTANNGDKIFVAAHHSESLIEAGTVTADIAGIQIIGLGAGNERPTFTATTDAAASFLISAADVYVANLKFVCNITSQTAMVDINAKRAIIDGCRFEEGTQTGLAFIDINGGAANACDGVQVVNCEFYAPTAGNYDRAIELGEVADNVLLAGNWIHGDFDDAGIHNITGKVLTNLRIENNIVSNLQTGDHAIEIVSACTGDLVSNKLYADAEATILDPGSLKCIDNYAVDAIDAGSFEIPYPADDAANYIGTNSANNDADTSLVVANADGSVLERLEFLQGTLIPDLGGLVFSGTCDTGMTGSTTTIVCAHLSGYGNDFFNTKYWMQVIKNTNSVGAAPELQVRQITDYVSATGTFTTAAFGANVEEGDSIMVIHESLVAIGRNDADNAFVSTAVVENADGSILERLEHLKGQNSFQSTMLSLRGDAAVGMAASATTIVSADLIGFGDDIFNDKYYMQVIKNANAVGTAPEFQVRKITDYVSATGTFTVDAFGSNVEETDELLILHEAFITLGRDDANNVFDSSTVVANANGSILERLEFIQSALASDLVGLSFTGTCDTGMAGSTTTIVCAGLGGYGDDTFNTKYWMQVIKNSNSVGAAPETQVRQITDYVSATGTFTTAAFGANVEEADIILVLHESLVTLGRNDGDNAFDSTNVVANGDGSVLERLEYMQALMYPELSGLWARGVVTTGASTTSIAASSLAGYGDDYFNNKYYMQVVKNNDGVGTAPEGEIRKITDYVSGAGTFTVDAFSGNVDVPDVIMILHESLLNQGSGDVHIITKNLTSSNIPQDGVSTVDVTTAAVGGALILEEVTMNTDGTGLAAGTNFQLEISGNTYGVTGAIMAETVANLGANATVAGTAASVTPLAGAVVEAGAKVVACSTVAACTGGGIIQLQLKFRRVNVAANLTAA